MDDESLRRKAEEIAADKIGFQIHLGVYIAVNISLVAAWYYTSNPHGSYFPWFIFPLAGWGIGIAFHFFGAYRGERYKAALTEREYERLKKQKHA